MNIRHLFRKLWPLAFAVATGTALFAIAQQPQGVVHEARPAAPALRDTGAWFNSTPLTIEALRGKVVLVDFWTYDCINCQRHLPHVSQWAEKYKDRGLVVIGVHTPEFAFERKTENVRDAIARLRIKHPVVQDNDYGSWRSFGNQYWPADYLIDREGRLVYTHVGEGGYDEMARRIEALLAEAPPATGAAR